MPKEGPSQRGHETPQNPFAEGDTYLRPSHIQDLVKKKVERGPRFHGDSATEASMFHPDRNEDALYLDADRGIAAVFDGVGGAPAGDFASRAAARVLDPRNLSDAVLFAENEDAERQATEIERVFTAPANARHTDQDVEMAMSAILHRMNDAMLVEARTNPEVRARAIKHFIKRYKKISASDPKDIRILTQIQESIGCTASIVKTWHDASGNGHVTVGQVGDSRVYRLHDDGLERLTRDDSYVEMLIDYGLLKNDRDMDQTIDMDALQAFAQADPTMEILLRDVTSMQVPRLTLDHIRHIMTQNIGMERPGGSLHLIPQVRTYDLKNTDVLLVVSDGISDNLLDEEIETVLKMHHDDPKLSCEELVRMAQIRSRSYSHARAKPDDMTAVVLATKQAIESPKKIT